MDSKVIALFLIGLIYGITAYLFYTYYSDTQQTIKALNSMLDKWKNDYQKLFENYTSLFSQYTNLSESYNQTLKELSSVKKNLSEYKEKYIKLMEDYDNLQEEYNKTQKELERWEYSRKIRNYADLDEIREFLEFDDTDEMEYDAEDWNCEDYTNLLIRKLMEKGIFACETELVFEDDTAHAIVAIETEPGKIYYIEPQQDRIIPGSWLYVGADYCDVVNWACDDWIIKKISSCFYISSYDR